MIQRNSLSRHLGQLVHLICALNFAGLIQLYLHFSYTRLLKSKHELRLFLLIKLNKTISILISCVGTRWNCLWKSIGYAGEGIMNRVSTLIIICC